MPLPPPAYTNLPLPKLSYNAVLCNLYRNGNDSVGLHADAEPEMGPVIASVSLGSERLFRLKAQNGAVAFAKRLPQRHSAPSNETIVRRRRMALWQTFRECHSAILRLQTKQSFEGAEWRCGIRDTTAAREPAHHGGANAKEL